MRESQEQEGRESGGRRLTSPRSFQVVKITMSGWLISFSVHVIITAFPPALVEYRLFPWVWGEYGPLTGVATYFPPLRQAATVALDELATLSARGAHPQYLCETQIRILSTLVSLKSTFQQADRDEKPRCTVRQGSGRRLLHNFATPQGGGKLKASGWTNKRMKSRGLNPITKESRYSLTRGHP